MWISLLIAAVLLIGTLAGLYLLQRHLKGEPLRLPRLSRAAPQKNAKSDELEQFIAAYRRDKAQAAAPGALASGALAPGVPAPPGAPAPPEARATGAAAAAAPSAPAPAPLVAATIKPKASFLAGPNKLLFLVLRTALPDHQIFPNVRLADAVQIAGQPPTPQQRAQLAQARVDFVICNKELAVVALLDITDGNRADDVLKRQLEPQVIAGGGRYLRVAPNAIPKPAEVRALVCGA